MAARFEYATLQEPATDATMTMVAQEAGDIAREIYGGRMIGPATIVERVAQDEGEMLARAAIGLVRYRVAACTAEEEAAFAAAAKGRIVRMRWPQGPPSVCLFLWAGLGRQDGSVWVASLYRTHSVLRS